MYIYIWINMGTLMSIILISNCKPLLYLDPWLAWVGSIGQDESIICEFVGVKPTNVLEYNNLHNIYIYIYEPWLYETIQPWMYTS